MSSAFSCYFSRLMCIQGHYKWHIKYFLENPHLRVQHGCFTPNHSKLIVPKKVVNPLSLSRL